MLYRNRKYLNRNENKSEKILKEKSMLSGNLSLQDSNTNEIPDYSISSDT